MYESFYGFSGKPFQLTPDPDFFYASRGHKRAMSYLEYGLHQGEGFIVVTGDVGAGKTTILRALLAQIPADRIVAAQIVSTQLEADDLVRMVARAFGIPDARGDKATVMHRLERYFVDLMRQGKRALLVVDEAQNLSQGAVEELRMLSNIQIGKQAPMQSFLVGQPEFREMMRSPSMQQLRQRVIASYHLGPLEADETRPYIEHRLRRVGWTGSRPQIDAGAFEAVHRLSGGVPRRINSLVDRVLLAGCLAENPLVGAADVQIVADELDRELGLADVPAAADPGANAWARAWSNAQAGARPDARADETAAAPRGLRDADVRLGLEHLAEIRAKLESIEAQMQRALAALPRRADEPLATVDRDPGKGPVIVRRAGA